MYIDKDNTSVLRADSPKFEVQKELFIVLSD